MSGHTLKKRKVDAVTAAPVVAAAPCPTQHGFLWQAWHAPELAKQAEEQAKVSSDLRARLTKALAALKTQTLKSVELQQQLEESRHRAKKLKKHVHKSNSQLEAVQQEARMNAARSLDMSRQVDSLQEQLATQTTTTTKRARMPATSSRSSRRRTRISRRRTWNCKRTRINSGTCGLRRIKM